MTGRELLILLANRDIDKEVLLEVKTDKAYDYSYGIATHVSEHGDNIVIGVEG